MYPGTSPFLLLGMCDMCYDYFCPVFGLPFCFLNISFEEQMFLNFDELQFIFFGLFLTICAFCSLRNLCLPQGFLTSALLPFGQDRSLLRGCPVRCAVKQQA